MSFANLKFWELFACKEVRKQCPLQCAAAQATVLSPGSGVRGKKIGPISGSSTRAQPKETLRGLSETSLATLDAGV